MDDTAQGAGQGHGAWIPEAQGSGSLALPVVGLVDRTGSDGCGSDPCPLEDSASAVALLQKVMHLLGAHVAGELVRDLSVRGLHAH